MSIFGKTSREKYLEERVTELEIIVQATIDALRNQGFIGASLEIDRLYKKVK